MQTYSPICRRIIIEIEIVTRYSELTAGRWCSYNVHRVVYYFDRLMRVSENDRFDFAQRGDCVKKFRPVDEADRIQPFAAQLQRWVM